MLRPRGAAPRPNLRERTRVFARGAVELLVAESDPVRFQVEREGMSQYCASVGLPRARPHRTIRELQGSFAKNHGAITF
jgi:hypothetical protein